MTYTEWRKKEEELANRLPLFYAFSNQQLDDELAKRNVTVKDIYRLSVFPGAFYLKADSEKIRDYFNRDSCKQLRELMMSDTQLAEEAIEYEMYNHEYPINWQGDWDVCSCFGGVEYKEDSDYRDYLSELGFNDEIIALYGRVARKVRSEGEW